MKKISLIVALVVLFITGAIIVACEKTTITPSTEVNNSTEMLARKPKPRPNIVVAVPSVYYSPDAATPYPCYTPCTTTPAPTGVAYYTYSGTVLQAGLENLGYSATVLNYADSIQYIFSDGTTSVCWTEKWCNTNGCFVYTAPTAGQVSLKDLFTQAGVSNPGNSVTCTMVAYGNGGNASPSFTTSAINVTY